MAVTGLDKKPRIGEMIIEGSLFVAATISILTTIGIVYVATLVARAAVVYPLAFTHGRHWPSGWRSRG